MARCTICDTTYYRQSEIDPAEQCGWVEMADCSPWKWDRWRGVVKWARCRVAGWFMAIATRLWP